MVRPSPFCVLDEMDAPLDESNINRFIRVLDRFVAQSQFIIITHNKRTIAKADILYGVTMEERGMSKLVGMKMTATAPRAEQASNPQREAAPSQAPIRPRAKTDQTANRNKAVVAAIELSRFSGGRREPQKIFARRFSILA